MYGNLGLRLETVSLHIQRYTSCRSAGTYPLFPWKKVPNVPHLAFLRPSEWLLKHSLDHCYRSASASPRTPQAVKAFKVFCGSGGHDGIAPFINVTTHFQTKQFPCLKHECQRPLRPTLRCCLGIQCRLYDGQAFSFQQSLSLVQFLQTWEK